MRKTRGGWGETATVPFSKPRASYFEYVYLRAWHRLRNFGSQVTGRPSTPQGNQCQISHFLAHVGAGNIHVLVNWRLSKQGIYWPISHDRIAGSGGSRVPAAHPHPKSPKVPPPGYTVSLTCVRKGTAVRLSMYESLLSSRTFFLLIVAGLICLTSLFLLLLKYTFNYELYRS